MKTRYDLIIKTVFLCFVLVWLTPYLWLVLTSIKSRVDALSDVPVFIFVPTLEHYWNAFFVKGFSKELLNSLLIASSSATLSMIIGVPAAYVLSRFSFRGKKGLFFLVLTTRMAPPVALVLPLFIIFAKFGLINTYLGIIIVHSAINLSFVIWMMKVFFDEVPKQLDEIAYLDGDTIMGAFVRIVLPTSMPGLLSTFLFAFITSWNEFLLVSMLTGFETRSLTATIPGLVTPHGTYWGQVAAVGVVSTFPMMLIALITQRFLVTALTYGAIKR